ncbi:hypothetical protein FA13DRAFT_250644 [Coprinellus micaceus]|uniref:F-box domain-containing protein n=1 Tax=Coprinellus micaceus TaxID=71717 RepID=A0A4Y7TE22_COPMI|nr:hypothetical protein FA13DRAFT_250644 [Coprinellus micaceus]
MDVTSTQEHQAGLLDLPEELLLAICERLDNPTVFIFALVCRKLHQTCLPLCFKRFEIRNPEKHLKISLGEDPYTLDVISILNIAFHVKAIDRVTCRFVIPGHDISVIFPSIRRLEHLVRRLKSVRAITLKFGSDHCCCCKNPSSFKDSWLEDWSMKMGGLMGAILDKSVESVTLKGGRYLSHLFVFRQRKGGHSTKTPTALESLKMILTGRKERKTLKDVESEPMKEPLSIFKGEHWEFKRANSLTDGTGNDLFPQMRPETGRSWRLRSLNIQSMMFLMPPLLQWTVSTLQYSRIRRLTLNNLSINQKCWPAIFQLISSAAPGLSELALLKLRQILPKDLLSFLSQLPRLTVLSLGRDVDSWDSYELGPFPDFPKLITLHAPAVWVFKLFSTQTRGLECLESLSISYKLRNDGLNHWLQPSPTPSIPSLLHAQRRPLTLSVEVALGTSPGWKMFEDLKLGEDHPDVQMITGMVLSVDQEFTKEDIRLWTVLPKWLSMFTALRHLSLTGHNRFIDEEDTLGAMAEVVRATPLQLVTLDINGKEGALNQPAA